MCPLRQLAIVAFWSLAGPPLTLAAQDKSVPQQNDELQRSLTFNLIYLTDGIQLSDDHLVALRSAVYALSVQHRR
jgi:hypothetical protein